MSQNMFDKMQLILDYESIWTYIGIILIKCSWILAQTHIWKLLDKFWLDGIEVWLRQNLDIHWNSFKQMELTFGKLTTWSPLRIISVGYNCVSATRQIGNIWEHFQNDAIELQLTHVWKSITRTSLKRNWILTMKPFGHILD